jgi:hypothetical protein
MNTVPPSLFVATTDLTATKHSKARATWSEMSDYSENP